MMQRRTLTAVVYLLAAAASSGLFLNGSFQPGGTWSVALLTRLFPNAVPLLFVFAYPRYLFAAPSSVKRRKYAVLLHVVGAVTATVLFPLLALPFWENPLRDIHEWVPVLLVTLSVLSVFLVAALFLLLRNKSGLTLLPSLLFWPYWLMLALATLDRFWAGTPLQAVFYFLCFISPALLTFAAGTVALRPALSHACALIGLVSAPWLYWSAIRNTALGNVWLVFNVPDKELMRYPQTFYAALTIVSVGLMVLALATAAMRLLPSRWQLRGQPLCERTWPAVAVGLIFLVVWFSRSVMPYRIPGAMDFADWPVLQILHVEKRGLQFHETCVKVWGHSPRPFRVSVSGNNRRLFEYRFQDTSASGPLSEPLAERVRALVQSSHRTREASETVKPIRDWNADAWYFQAQGAGLKIYNTAHRSPPPQEILDLFQDLEGVPRSSQTRSEMKDVCLGFCYDPLSEMGALYANHRCRHDDHGATCR